MPTDFVYWPYDEVNVQKTIENDIVVQTPWLEAKVARTVTNSPKLDWLLNKFKAKNFGAEDLPPINEFFAHLDAHPFCYILPSPKKINSDQHEIVDDKLHQMSIAELITFAIESSQSLVPTLVPNALEAALEFETRNWEWSAQAATQFATNNGFIHPESLFSVARRYHLLTTLEQDRGKQVFATISTLSGVALHRALTLLVRQNHYVTTQCESALLPATELAQSASALVSDFIQQERGHDRLLDMALASMGASADSVRVSPMTLALMALLELTARRNFLAFAIAIDAFERSSYSKIDPLASLLSQAGFELAAKQINRHMQINESGEHHNIARNFLQSMAPCRQEYAVEALRLAEAVSLVMARVTGSSLDIMRQELNSEARH